MALSSVTERFITSLNCPQVCLCCCDLWLSTSRFFFSCTRTIGECLFSTVRLDLLCCRTSKFSSADYQRRLRFEWDRTAKNTWKECQRSIAFCLGELLLEYQSCSRPIGLAYTAGGLFCCSLPSVLTHELQQIVPLATRREDITTEETHWMLSKRQSIHWITQG